MRGTINIVVGVDVIAALSHRSLEESVLMMDDSPLPGENQGTGHLITYCWPGWQINWTVQQVDLQTPAAISSIRFGGRGGGLLPGATWAASGITNTLVWSGIVPSWVVPGYRYPYEIEVQMARGVNSVLTLRTASLIVPAA